MKKSDLQNGDIVKRRNGRLEIYISHTPYLEGVLICDTHGYDLMSTLNDDLTCAINKQDLDIVTVRRPSRAYHLALENWLSAPIIYDRKEPKKMTVAEICEELGYDVEVVK